MKHALLVVVNRSSAGKNPMFLIRPESYQVLRGKLAARSASVRRKENTFGVDSFTIHNIGGVPRIPERIRVDREAVWMMAGTRTRAVRDRAGLFDWLEDRAGEAGI